MNGGRKDSGPGPETPFTARSRSYPKPNDAGPAGVTSRTTNTSLSLGQVCYTLGVTPAELITLLRCGWLRISEESIEEYIAGHLPAGVAS